LSSLLVVATAGNCNIDLPPQVAPPKPVAGTRVGELFGVRLRLTMTESGAPSSFFNSTTVEGTGWLVYATTPADSVVVSLLGFNNGEPQFGPSFDIRRPDGTGSYGHYAGKLQADGSLLGNFERAGSGEPTPSPWTTAWPAGTTTAELRMTKQ
jgi:hypothetical protein